MLAFLERRVGTVLALHTLLLFGLLSLLFVSR
jgi:hypothetical protein